MNQPRSRPLSKLLCASSHYIAEATTSEISLFCSLPNPLGEPEWGKEPKPLAPLPERS